MPDYAGLDRLQRALNPLPGAAVDGAHQMSVTGTVNIVGGGSGGTSMTDNSPFTPGSTSITPAGGYYGPRSISSGNAAAPALSASAIMLVDVRAGGAGGGVANVTVRGTANSDLHVGYASGAGVNVDGGAYLPILGTVNTVGGSGLGTVGVYGSVGAYGTMAVYGSPANPVYNVGSVNVVNNVGIFGSVSTTGSVIAGVYGSAGIYGSVGVAGSVMANVVVQGTGGTFYQVGYASTNVGAWPNYNGAAWLPVMFPSGFYATVNITGSLNTVGVTGSVSMAGTVNIAGQPLSTTVASFMYSDSTNSAVRVNVVAGGAGGGVANITVTGTANTALHVGYASWNNPGVNWPNIANFDGAAPLPVVYGSGYYASLNIAGSVSAGVGGSVGIYGSVGVFGSVNIIGVPKVDTSASLSPSMFLIGFAASGNQTVINAGSLSSNPGNNQVKLYNLTLISDATVNLMLQSPSGTNLTGTMTLLPGAGFVVNGAIRNPVFIGAASGSINAVTTATAHIGGWAMGYVE